MTGIMAGCWKSRHHVVDNVILAGMAREGNHVNGGEDSAARHNGPVIPVVPVFGDSSGIESGSVPRVVGAP